MEWSFILDPLLHQYQSPHFNLKLKLLCKSIYVFVNQYENEYPTLIDEYLSIDNYVERLKESLKHYCKNCVQTIQLIDKHNNQIIFPDLTKFAIKNNLYNIDWLEPYEDNKLSNNDIHECVELSIKHTKKDAEMWISILFWMYKINNLETLQISTNFLDINSVNNYLKHNTINNILQHKILAILFPYLCKYKMEEVIGLNYDSFDLKHYVELMEIISKESHEWNTKFIDTFYNNYLKTDKITIKNRKFIIDYAVNNKNKELVSTILNKINMYDEYVNLLFPLIEELKDLEHFKIINNDIELTKLFNIKAIKSNFGTLYLESLSEQEILQIMHNTNNQIFIKKCVDMLIYL